MAARCARTASRSSAAGSSSAPPTATTPSTSRRICCNRTSPRAGRPRSGQAASPRSGRARAGFILLSSLTYSQGAWWAGPSATVSRRTGLAGPEHGHRDLKATIKLHSSHGSRVAILRPRRSEAAAQTRLQGFDEWERELLRQFRCRKLLQLAEGRVAMAAELANPPRRRSRPLPLSWFAGKQLPGYGIHQRLLQPAPQTLSARMEIIRGLRTTGRPTSAPDRNETGAGPKLPPMRVRSRRFPCRWPC